MKKNLLITCVMLLFAVVSMAQNKITVSGVVSDKTGMYGAYNEAVFQ